MERVPVLRDGDLELKPIDEGDLPAIHGVLGDPTVQRWWGIYDDERVRREFADPEDEVVFLINVGGETAGIIQYGEELDPDYYYASIDIAITERFQGKGLGPSAIRLLAAYLFDVRGHHRITIDPAVANRNAIRAYESVGFRPVGVMRKYERGADGTWHDNLLMDMLVEEFKHS